MPEGCRFYVRRGGQIMRRPRRVTRREDYVVIGGVRWTGPGGRLPHGSRRVLVCKEGRRLKVVGHGGAKEPLRRMKRKGG